MSVPHKPTLISVQNIVYGKVDMKKNEGCLFKQWKTRIPATGIEIGFTAHQSDSSTDASMADKI